MRLEQLEYFIEAVKCKSINKAAKNLFISQPTLSLAIAKLEEEIGAKLLHRTNKGVIPTITGSMVYNDALRIVGISNSFFGDWQQNIVQNSNIAGNVSVYCIPSASVFISNFVIQELKESSPSVRMLVYEGQLHEDLNRLLCSKINIGFGSYKVPLEKEFMSTVPDNWSVDRLFSDRLSVLISPRNPMSKKDFITKEDCEQLPLAFYWNTNEEHEPSYLRLFDADSAIRANTKSSILQLVAENNAVAIFPQKITQHDFYRKNNVINSVLFDETINLPEIMHYVAYRNDLTDAERKVVDTIHYCAQVYYE